jgi:hypothetical protein
MEPGSGPRLPAVAGLCGCAFMLALLAGCQVPAFFAANLLPRQKIKAAYQLTDQPTVIFVDDRRRALPSAQLVTLIAERAGRDLAERGVIKEFVPPTLVDDLRHSEEDFDTWPIDKVGQRVGARQVIYVLIDAFDPGGTSEEVRRPTAVARLKVVDAQTGKRLFPDRIEHGVTATLQFKHPPIDESSHGREAAIARKLAQRLGQDIALQFLDHEAREVGSGFEE